MVASALNRWVRALRGSPWAGIVWPALALAVVLALSPLMSTSFQLKWTLWLSFAILALSLDFLWGVAGIFSFGQNAFFGLGAYGFAVAAINLFPESGETLSALFIGASVAASSAVVIGYVTFYGRVGDVYLAIVTLSVTLILYMVMSSTAGPEYTIGAAQLGGFNGMPSVPGVALGDGELSMRAQFLFAVTLTAALFALTAVLVRGRFGRILAGIRENEARMELLGYDVRRYKLGAFVVAAAIAGLGGGLFAAWGTFVNPAVFNLTQAAMVAIWVMVGGRGTLSGALVGVAAVQWMADAADKIVAQQTPLVLGIVMVLVVLVFPGGIVPALGALRRRVLPARVPEERPDARETTLERRVDPGLPVDAAAPVRGGRLEVEGAYKRFGGVEVLRGVDLEFGAHPVTSVIGPNGAGKSTLFALLSGRHLPSQGRIRMNGADITTMPSFRRARMGLGIKLQVPSIFPGLSVADNVALALMAHPGPSDAAAVARVLARVGLQHRVRERASQLAHGEQQWLEIALVLAQNPSVILLDEPAAGMTEAERTRTVELIRELAVQHTLVVVEHDMAFIRALEAPVVMLHQGKVFRTGTFEDMNADEQVRAVYLGRRDAPAR
ncbi:MAG: ATP-binding cassette domain-containing protein [Betaproteobacteria bacterium]|nr:ATP-binding cassette domain-containing protein [Betaproteobacteria bacterium]